MKTYLKLLHWEMNRFARFFAALAAVVLLLQTVGVILWTQKHMAKINDILKAGNVVIGQPGSRLEPVHFGDYAGSSLWFNAPIALCAVALLLYCFLTWYREWSGKNTFIYRLLMLPSSRMAIFFAKLSLIVLAVLGLVALQLVYLTLEMKVFVAGIPTELLTPVSVPFVVRESMLLSILLPKGLTVFALSYLAGVLGVSVVFTGILLERCYRIKGLLAGLVYGATSLLVFFAPVWIVTTWFENVVFDTELFAMTVAAGTLVLAGSLWFSAYLLRHKITV